VAVLQDVIGHVV